MGITKYIYNIINFFTKKDEKMLIFIPHGGCKTNRYSINNFKSDNTLSFLNYLIKKYGDTYKYCIAVDFRELDEQKALITSLYPYNNIKCFPYFNIQSNRILTFLYNYCNIINIFSKSKYIFSSESVVLPIKNSKQIYTILGYFIPFKNDYNLSYVKHSNVNLKKQCNYYITTSLLSSQIISHTYDIPLYKFKILGFSRNDNLLQMSQNILLETYIKSLVSYKINKIVLYTPTHRDYERIEEQNTIRSLLGFEVNKQKFESFLKDNGILIICKLHSAQNSATIKKCMPKGVVSFDTNNSYGLCELMQYSDALITDYTSAYFDYLLLDRPVIFNFYDFEKYRDFRGFSYEPIDSILAGDIIKNEEELLNALRNIIDGIDTYKDKRNYVLHLHHKYIDSNSSERIYNLVFCNDKKNS